MLGLGSKGGGGRLWQDVKSAGKLTGGDNDKGEDGGVGENKFAGERFLCEVLAVGNRSPVDLVNSVGI